MFERYTEKTRRVVFFARYEASLFGSPYIETEHLLLGLLREDKVLAHRLLRSHAAVEAIRKQIEAHTPTREKISTSVDLPLSHESKRVLAYASEESERLNHKAIETSHLLIGLLCEQKCFAAQFLHEQGLTLDSVREQLHRPEPAQAQRGPASIAGLDRWLAEREAQGVWSIKQRSYGNTTAYVVSCAHDPPNETENDQELSPAEKLAQIRQRIDFIVERMEHAIANHEFEKARFYSDEERRERETMRRLCEQFNLEEPPSPAPRVCIEIIRNDLFSDVRKRGDDYIAEGVAEVWLLDPLLKRAYTVTETAGLREFTGDILRIADPPLEMDLRRIFE